MLIVSDEIIESRPITNALEKEYFAACVSSDEYKTYIGKDSGRIKRYVLYYRNRMIGCYTVRIIDAFGIRKCYPNIFVEQKIFSISAVLRMVCDLFTVEKVDKVCFLVYSHNRRCLKLLEQLGITCDGCFKRTVEMAGEERNSFVFSILSEELTNFKQRMNSIWK